MLAQRTGEVALQRSETEAPETNLAITGLRRRYDALLQQRRTVARLYTGALRRERLLRKGNARLQYERDHDSLTGLWNKRAWEQRVRERVNQGEAIGILVLDFDLFKKINDTLGHSVGDNVLSDWGVFVKAAFERSGDMIAGRLGGDEFGIAVNLDTKAPAGVDRRPEHPYNRLNTIYDYTLQVVGQFVASRGTVLTGLGFNVSIGAAASTPEWPVDYETLLKQADESMYEAKASR